MYRDLGVCNPRGGYQHQTFESLNAQDTYGTVPGDERGGDDEGEWVPDETHWVIYILRGFPRS